MPSAPLTVEPPASTAAGQDFALLPQSIRTRFELTLSREEAAKKIGIVNPPSFPLPVCIRSKCGALDRNGTFVIEPAYDRVSLFHEGRAVVQMRNGSGYLYGYVAENGRVIAPPQFAVRDRFSQNLIHVDIGGNSGMIDDHGQLVLEPRFGFAVAFTDGLFWVTQERRVVQGNNGEQTFLSDGTIEIFNGVSDTYIMPEGKWGLVDRLGGWIRQPEFLSVRMFERGSRAMWIKTEAGWGLIRPDLSWQIEPRFEQVGVMHEGLAMIALNGRWGFIDASGQIVIDPTFERVLEFSGPYAPARVNNLFGLIDRTGAWVVEPQYDLIFSHKVLIPHSWWTVKTGEKYGLLDDSLHPVIRPQLDGSIAMCFDGRIIGFRERTAKLFSHDGTPVDNDEAGCDSLITSRRH
jgi:hypothetical protein